MQIQNMKRDFCPAEGSNRLSNDHAAETTKEEEEEGIYGRLAFACLWASTLRLCRADTLRHRVVSAPRW